LHADANHTNRAHQLSLIASAAARHLTWSFRAAGRIRKAKEVPVNDIYRRGACVSSGKHDLFFSDSPADLEAAQALCACCSARIACLHAALEEGIEWGVWGGVIFWEGQPFYRRRGRGRPRRDDRDLPLEADVSELWELVR
jgi:WhiB family redox-sensing transcriptional regulator